MFNSFPFKSEYYQSVLYPRFGPKRTVFSIGGKNALKYILVETLNIDQTVNNRGSASFQAVGKDGYRPLIGEEVIIEYKPCDGEQQKRIFAGTIERVDEVADFCNDEFIIYQIDAVDYNQILDRRLCFNIYKAQKVGDVILDIIDQFADGEGIDTSMVNDGGLLLEKAVFSYVKISKALDDISKNTGLHWYIDYFKRLNVFPRSERQTNVVIKTDCLPGGAAADFCAWIEKTTCNEGAVFKNIAVQRTRERVTNKQWTIAGWDETSLRTEEFVGDKNGSGSGRSSFSLKYPLSTLQKNPDDTIADTAIRLNGVNQSVAERDDDPDSVAEWFFSKGENTISQNDDSTPLDSADVLEITYKGLFKIITIGKDNISIAQRGIIENGSGKYEGVEDDESIESRLFAQQRSDGLVRRFKDVPQILTMESDILALEPGDIIQVVLPVYQVNDSFLVTDRSIADATGGHYVYSYSLVSTEFQGGWQDFFKKIEYFGRQLKLREQEKLVTIEKIIEEIGISQEFSWLPGFGSMLSNDLNCSQCYMHADSFPSQIGQAYHCQPQDIVLELV